MKKSHMSATCIKKIIIKNDEVFHFTLTMAKGKQSSGNKGKGKSFCCTL